MSTIQNRIQSMAFGDVAYVYVVRFENISFLSIFVCVLLLFLNSIVFGCSVDEKARFVLYLGRFIVIAEYHMCESNLVAILVFCLVSLFRNIYVCVCASK